MAMSLVPSLALQECPAYPTSWQDVAIAGLAGVQAVILAILAVRSKRVTQVTERLDKEEHYGGE